MSDWPDVAVVIPVRNEAAHLRGAVAAVTAQNYPGRLGVCLAVAPSDDDTSTIAGEIATSFANVTVVPNPRGGTPSGLNAAIEATTGDVIVRVDGHAELAPGYIRRAVETLARTGAANVGGVQRAVGTTPFESAVADAMTSKFGTGDAAFHYGGDEGPTDTVYLGVFARRWIEAVGLFDERLDRNQDYELNIRLRQAGGTVWFDPQLHVVYRPRGSLRALAKQYFEYGRWKRIVVGQHPRSLRWRQAIPPVVTATIAVASVGGVFWHRALAVPAAYFVAVGVAAAGVGTTLASKVRLLAVFPAMHLSWGAGFLTARFRPTQSERRPVSRLARNEMGPA